MPHIVPMPICEICDRMTIAMLKLTNLPDDEIDKTLLKKQIAHYREGIDPDDKPLAQLIRDLHAANASIWKAEHELRSGFERNLGLEEVGRRAVVIRDCNRVRVRIKNEITRYAGQPEFLDCKSNHLSETRENDPAHTGPQ
jgi:hypothetical protein